MERRMCLLCVYEFSITKNTKEISVNILYIKSNSRDATTIDNKD